MKILIISILLFISVNAQNIWYVNRDTPVRDNPNAQNGKSWATAWQDLDSTGYWNDGCGVNWNIIQPGDSIYISGGTDSTRYTPKDHAEGQCIYGVTMVFRNNEIYSFAGGEPVVITKAWHPNHNGDVYFVTNNNGQQRAFDMQNVSNVKFLNLNFMNVNNPDLNGGSVLSLGQASNTEANDSLVTFENCYFYTTGTGAMIGMGSTKTTIRNCIIDMQESDYDNDNDAMGFAGGRGGHTIDNNIIIFRNGSMTTGAHRDVLQFSNFGQREPVERLTTTISNNLIIDTRPEGIGWNAIVYSSGPYCNQTFYIYNNIFVTRKEYTNAVPLFMYHPGEPQYYDEFGRFKQSYHILNNTFIMKGTGGGPVTLLNSDTTIVKNNIMVVDTSNYLFYSLDGHDGFPVAYKDIDYNLLAEKGGISVNAFGFENGDNRTFSQWRSLYSYDINSITMDSRDLVFSSKYGLNKDDYYTMSGRDAGVNLWNEYPFLRYDVLGNPRSQSGSWDIGALEFQGSQSNNINVKSKIFLQGPFNTNSMNTNLSQNGSLPNTQPFNTAPWNYNGSESLSSGSSSSFVDWVLVELRSSSNPTQVVARRAAILKNDGSLLNSDGSIGVPFSNVQEGSYYIAVFHRNHLSVMSAAPVLLSANSTVYDFSVGMNKAFGTNPMANLGNGIFGMYAGDGNSNGGITIADRNEVWLPQNGTLGYLNGDFNIDGGVTIHDINLYWNINNGTMTQVP
jgi:hypothetical protein